MKKLLFILGFISITATTAVAQRFAYVDSDYILKHMPEYASAQRQLEALSTTWQKEVDQKYQEIDRFNTPTPAD
jgi:outer membrane protein